MIQKTHILVVFLALLVFAGCSQEPPIIEQTPQEAQTEPVTVNGEVISAEQIENVQQQLTVQTGQQVTIQQARQTAIQQALLQQEVQARNYSVSQEEAQQVIIAQLEAQNVTLEQYQEQVGMGVYEQTLSQAQQQLGVQRLLEDLVDPVSSEQAQEFYDENPSQFVQGNVTVSFEDAQEDIQTFLEQQAQQIAVQELVMNLTAEATIQ